jgi:steroid 5-alpha reductase family enzyme
MLKTVAVLLFTIIVIPIVSFYVDEPLTVQQKEILVHLLFSALTVAIVCFLVGHFTGNNSQVDKLWSILPIGYVWYVAYAGGFTERLVLMAVLVTIWGARLTYNFSRRGAYQWKFWTGEEDYRWEVLRNNPMFKGHKTRWVCFICSLSASTKTDSSYYLRYPF